MPYAILFAETHHKLFRNSNNNFSGIFLRQIWTFSALILTASFCSNLRATITVRQSEKPLLTNEEVMQSGKPVILVLANSLEYEQLQFSPVSFDRWLYHSSTHVYYWGR